MRQEEDPEVRGPAVTPAERRDRLVQAKKMLAGGYWTKNTWDIKKCPLPAAKPFRTVAVRNRYIRFGSIGNATIRDEAKCILHDALVAGRTNPQTVWIRKGSDLASIARFLNDTPVRMKSLADIDPNEAVAAYAEALEQRGVHSRSVNWKVGEDGKKRAVSVASYHLTVLRQLLEGARLLYAATDPWYGDVWETNALPIRPEKLNPVGSAGHVLDFRRIPQERCRSAAKSYLRRQLELRWSGAHAKRALGILTRFFNSLERKHPEADALDVRQQMVDEWLGEVAVLPAGTTTHNRYRHSLSSFLEFCNRNPGMFAAGLVVETDAYERSERGRRDLMPLDKQKQLPELIASLESPYRQMAQIIQLSAWRISEVLSLTRNCLRKGASGGTELYGIARKTYREAVIPLEGTMKPLQGIVLECIKRSEDLYGDRTPYLFPSCRDVTLPCRAEELYRALDTARTKAHLDYRFRCHEIRHLRITQLYEQGLGPKEIALLVGHRSVDMTETYIHPDIAGISQRLREFNENRVQMATAAARALDGVSGRDEVLPGDEVPARQTMTVGHCHLAPCYACTDPQSKCILSCKSWAFETGDVTMARTYEKALIEHMGKHGDQKGSDTKAFAVLRALEDRIAKSQKR